MSKKVFIHAYKMGSASATALATSLGGLKIKTDGTSKYRYRKSHTVINWGSSTDNTKSGDTPMINAPDKVANASNKLKFFEMVRDSITVPYTSDKAVAEQWDEDGKLVVARTKLTGSCADGLVICDEDVDIPDCKLYTVYMPKAREYRVHVAFGEVIRIQRKILKPELSERIKDKDDTFTADDVNWKVRNHGNGFVYVTGGVDEDCPVNVKTYALQAVQDCELDFGAVDLIYNAKKGSTFVLEVNTSPGLEGETLTTYVDAFKKFMKNGSKRSASPAVASTNRYSDFPFEIMGGYGNARQEYLRSIKTSLEASLFTGRYVGPSTGTGTISWGMVQNQLRGKSSWAIPGLPRQVFRRGRPFDFFGAEAAVAIREFYEAYLVYVNQQIASA